MRSRNSWLELVCFSDLMSMSMARSVEFVLARMRRTPQMSGASCGSMSSSSLRVPEEMGSMAGKMRRSAR